MGKSQILLILFLIVCCLIQRMKAGIKEDAVKKANIYYQQPLKNGVAHEFRLDSIEKLSSKKNLTVVVHGFIASPSHYSITPLKNAYLAQGRDNFFMANWEEAAAFSYLTSRYLVGEVGVWLAQILDEFLIKHNISRSEVHLIGHSLGAHVVGNMGRYFNGTLKRVTGLDPALPLFSPDDADSLQSNAARFVDVIHTGYRVYGDITPRGTADFYPNYGRIVQKGCEKISLSTISKLIFKTHSCSHVRAVQYYAETVGNHKIMPGVPCTENAIMQRKSELCLEGLRNNTFTKSSLAAAIELQKQEGIAYMGEGVSTSASGLYYLETNDAPPYGQGLFTQIP